MESQDAIRARIRQRLDDLGIGAKPASESAGLGETTLRNFLKGMTRSLTVETVEKLAPVLQVSPRWILFGEDEKVVEMWDRIPTERREQALDILKTFTA